MQEFLNIHSQLHEIASGVVKSESTDATVQLMKTALRLGAGLPSGTRLKLIDQSLGEFLQAAQIFAPHAHMRKVAIFGSARAHAGQEEFQMAELVAAQFVRAGFMVITGAGPGIMAAAQKGAGAENSFGLRILLPFENKVNPTIAGDPKLLEFEYFFTRKVSFARESNAFLLFPGGLGTLDESFEILTLMQTGKTPIVPVVMIEKPNGNYWQLWDSFIREGLLGDGHVSEQDMNLFYLSSGLEDALAHVCRFYKNFHSYRWSGDEVEIIVNQPVSKKALGHLNDKFASLCSSGDISQKPCAAGEESSPGSGQFQLNLIPHKRRFGEIRLLIDEINALTLERSQEAPDGFLHLAP